MGQILMLRALSAARWSWLPIATRMSPASGVRLRRRIEEHVPRLLFDRDDDHLMFRPQLAVFEVAANERTVRLHARFFQLQFDLLGLRRQLDEIDDCRLQHGMSHARPADLVGGDDAIGAGAYQFLLRLRVLDPGHDKQFGVEEPGAHRREQVVRIGGHHRDEAVGPLNAGLLQQLVGSRIADQRDAVRQREVLELRCVLLDDDERLVEAKTPRKQDAPMWP